MPGSTPNRERILSSAQTLILRKGFPSTTVDEICEEAGVTKGGFYYHFPSKDQLAIAVADHYFDSIARALAEGDHRRSEDPFERVLGFVDQAVSAVRGPVLKDGCVLGSMALDMAETHPELRSVIAARFSALAKIFEGELRAAFARSASTADSVPDAGVLARQFIAVLQGSIILAKAHGNTELMAEALGCFRQTLTCVLSSHNP